MSRDEIPQQEPLPDERMAFLDRLEQVHASDHSGAGARRPAAVYLVLDQGRSLRDRLGFRRLDALVRALQSRVAECLGEADVMASFGETDFAILRSASDRNLDAWAAGLLKQVGSRLLDTGEESLSVTISIGVCPFDSRIESAEATLLQAVRAAEATSTAGGNRVSLLEPSVSAEQAGGNEAHLTELLTTALRENSLRVVYQPLLSVSGENSSRFQMLPRLKADDGGLIPAASFVPVAARKGLLPALDRWILARAMRVLAESRTGDRVMRLFINQSPALLDQADLSAWLKRKLEAVPGVAAGLVLDFRLPELQDRSKHAGDGLGRLKALGVGICLSGIDEDVPAELLLEHLPCDYLRMGPDFAERMLADRNLFDRYSAFVARARAAGRRIIIPMLENEKTVAGIWRAPVDFIQGNFIQKPGDKPVFHDS